MKILHVINSSNPAGGGPIESIVQAHRTLAPQGHVFEMVCVDPPDSPWLGGFPFPVHAMGPAVTKYRYASRLAPWLRQHAREYDVAILHGIWLHPSCAARQALLDAGVPYFVYTHGLLDPSFKRLFPFKHLRKILAWRLGEHRVLRDARAVFFTCEEEQRLAARSFRPYQCNGRIVPYCVGEPPGEADTQVRTFLQRFPECRDKRVLLFLSRIHPKKGCDLLLRAFARVADRDAALHLVLAGPDSIDWKKDLEKIAAPRERITWAGMLSGDLKWGAFRAAEAFILPSHQENFGIAVVEALACGTPVLISHKINIWREIEADGAGLVDSDDEAGALRLLEKWLRLSDSERDQRRANARSCFSKRFRAAEAAATLMKVLSEP